MAKRLNALWPIDPKGEEIMAGLRQKEVVKVVIKKPRSIHQHRLYWALMTKLWENQERYGSPEELSDVIKVYLGHCTVLVTSDGREIRIPKSISFAKMDQTEFNRFFDQVCEIVVTRIMPGLDEDALRREIAEMIDAPA